MAISCRHSALLVVSVLVFVATGCRSSAPDFLRSTPSVRIYRIDTPTAVEPAVDDLWLGKDELDAVSIDSVSVEVVLDKEEDGREGRPYREMAVLHILYAVPPVKPHAQEAQRRERQRMVMAKAGHLIGADAVILLKNDAEKPEDWTHRRQERWQHDDLDREYSCRVLAVRFMR